MLILVIIHFIISHYVILAEERHFLKIYKNTYKKYMDRVPRYLLFF
jgi:protein-S-isoprenylcysteine O-methyltransferase Ste14